MPSLLRTCALLGLTAAASYAQTFSSSDSGYAGYHLGIRGDGDSAVYETDSTDTANSSALASTPDVYLNASVNVAEIDIIVANLSAKVNLDLEVLNLLTFNAGVDVSIDRVDLLIQNVTAKVLLEARLGNLVTMVADVLDSIDLNPVIATVSSGLDDVVGDTADALSSTSSGLSERSYDVEKNILYSVNDYSGNTHTNRILEQDGSIVDQYLDNNGNVRGQKTVGSYSKDMTSVGHTQVTTIDGREVQQTEYTYKPFPGLSVISAIYINAANAVVAARVLSESSAGGSSTVGNS